MPVTLSTREADFAARFESLLGAKRESSVEVGETVAAIIDRVKTEGDAALIALSKQFDRLDLTPQTLAFSQDEIEAGYRDTDPAIVKALEVAASRIRAYHEKQKPADQLYTDATGVTLGAKWTAVEGAGIYVPGGTASYPSSVLMNAIPARVAGVERIAMVVPTPDGAVNPAVLAAAKIAGITEIYRIGGAQAIAALAFGTQTVKPVTKIVGPGNAYVAAAKRQVYGQVGIDMIAGPSEVLVIADSSANPAWIAADLLAQAEHDAAAQSVLVTPDADLADAVAREVERQLALLPRAQIAGASWADFGALIVTSDLDEALAIANRMAPEHLELSVENPEALLAGVRHAGAVFMGHHTPEAIGDYVGGTNHVLPTARSARFASGLGVYDFLKRVSILGCTPSALAELAGPAETLAAAEGLDAHGRSVAIRRN
ncbi:histidinol dehydrogenase [Cucumibacter marinus]|uniref:histidinol dehydrogenase n=1 Tax=Cucumibacter marinus TaxID=1121252 RepID=UPI000429237A|nr:histidinol dehydrogenase [Cucumibacter marinus]